MARAEAAIDRLKHVNVWAVGGHSMGGPAAADLLGLLKRRARAKLGVGLLERVHVGARARSVRAAR